MSSHHIVREDQEPALLIVNAHAMAFEKIQELLEWMPTVIVLADQVETVVAWGIKVDVVIVPLTAMELWRDKLADQTPVKLIPYNLKEYPMDIAFYFLSKSKANLSVKTNWISEISLLYYSEIIKKIIFIFFHFQGMA